MGEVTAINKSLCVSQGPGAPPVNICLWWAGLCSPMYASVCHDV